MFRRGFAALSLFVLTCAPHRESTAPPPAVYAGAPVILISVDTLRSDHLPAYGYRGVATPNIDALAADGIVYDHAWSHCPMTLPSHLTMLTGLLPTEHGVRNNLGFRFDVAKHPTIATRLRTHGYATGAAVSSYVLRGDTGLRNSFDWYDDAIDTGAGSDFSDYQRPGGVTISLAEQWLTPHASQPFFLFLHLYEPHVPYAPPEPFRSRYANPYNGEIAQADALLGEFVQFLKARGIYDKAIVVFTSDHGEGLGDHGEQQHSILLYREALQVPLIVKLPHAQRHGERIAAPAALIDIAPTIAALTGVEALQTSAAQSLLALPPSREIYGETIYPYVQLGWSDLRSMVTERFHYIDSPRPELYSLADDPHETKNVIDSERRAASDFRAKIATYPAANAVQPVVDAEVAAKLASLGYVGRVESRPDPRSLPNPRDSLAGLADVQKAFVLAQQRQYPAAIAALRAIVQSNPRLTDAWTRLAEVYTETGDVPDAVSAYKQALASSAVFSPEIALALGHLYLRTGQLGEADAIADAARHASPASAAELHARVLLARKDLASAERVARDLTGRANPTPAEFVLLGEILNARGDRAGALAAADSAAAKGTAYGLDALRGEAYAMSDRPQPAIAAYEKEIAAYPANRIAYSRLALLYFVTGDRARFEQTLARLVKANPTPPARDLAAQTRAAVGLPRK